MVLGKLPVPGRPTISITVGQGPIALAVGAGGDGLDIFTLIYTFFSFSLSKKFIPFIDHFYAPVTIVRGALRFAPVCLSVCPSVRSSRFTV